MSSSHTIAEQIEDATVAQGDTDAIAGALDELMHRIATGQLDAIDAAEIAAYVLPRITALGVYFTEIAATAASTDVEPEFVSYADAEGALALYGTEQVAA